jgi:hypothetical protein
MSRPHKVSSSSSNMSTQLSCPFFVGGRGNMIFKEGLGGVLFEAFVARGFYIASPSPQRVYSGVDDVVASLGESICTRSRIGD